MWMFTVLAGWGPGLEVAGVECWEDLRGPEPSGYGGERTGACCPRTHAARSQQRANGCVARGCVAVIRQWVAWRHTVCARAAIRCVTLDPCGAARYVWLEPG